MASGELSTSEHGKICRIFRNPAVAKSGKRFLSSFGKRLIVFPFLFFPFCALALGKVHAGIVSWGWRILRIVPVNWGQVVIRRIMHLDYPKKLIMTDFYFTSNGLSTGKGASWHRS